ncbi:MAG: tetratricopeptide repeat protein [Gammaproteobacteria bacterium]|nr:tetratricopeptide repeat protein [Gammaproteobacteria bacterium]
MFLKKLLRIFGIGNVNATKLNQKGKQLVDEARLTTPVGEDKYVSAIQLFKKILAEDSENVVALTNLGAVLTDMGSHETALKLLQKAESLGLEDAHLCHNIGAAMLHISSDTRSKAGYYFKKASNLVGQTDTIRALYEYAGQ